MVCMILCRKLQWLIGVITVFILLCIFSCPALSHKYLSVKSDATREDPIDVPDHRISWAVYTRLGENGEDDHCRFYARSGDQIYLDMMTPALSRLKDFDPIIALIGPDLSMDSIILSENAYIEKGDEVGDQTIEHVLSEPENDESSLICRYEGDEPEVFFEPFTQTRYYKKQNMTVEAPVSALYYAIVYDTTGESGKYVLAIGKKEQFGLRDLAAFPITWWRVRMFTEQRFSTYLITGLFISVIGLLSWLIVTRVRRGEKE